jgi:2-oxoglutarate dehydrogenase E1 component
MTPKSLLRHKLCVSRLDELGPDTSFHRVLWDDAQLVKGGLAPDDKIKRVVLCTGKVYYDLFEERAKRGVKDVYLMRVEQLYPFPHRTLIEELSRFKNAEIMWCQEEPKNMGAWSFILEPMMAVMEELKSKQVKPSYAGRVAAASPATGSASKHKKELDAFLDDALTVAAPASRSRAKAPAKAAAKTRAKK